MLRRTPSLALRAVLTFTGVYVVTIGIFLSVLVLTEDPNRDRQRHTGPRLALSRAAEDLVRTENGFRIRSDGSFAEMASRNPAMWLVARSGDKTFAFGRVPAPVARAFEPHGLLVQSGRLVLSVVAGFGIALGVSVVGGVIKVVQMNLRGPDSG